MHAHPVSCLNALWLTPPLSQFLAAACSATGAAAAADAAAFPPPLIVVCGGSYLTDLNSLKISSDAEVGDIEKVSLRMHIHRHMHMRMPSLVFFVVVGATRDVHGRGGERWGGEKACMEGGEGMGGDCPSCLSYEYCTSTRSSLPAGMSDLKFPIVVTMIAWLLCTIQKNEVFPVLPIFV